MLKKRRSSAEKKSGPTKLTRTAKPIIRDATFKVIASRLVPLPLRGRLLAKAGHNVHPSATICPSGFIGAWNGLTIGPRAFINYGCFFDLGAETTIGADTGLGYEVMLITCTHEPGTRESRRGASISRPVAIGRGCWIGARTVIMPGVTIGDGCVVAANSVVTSDCEPHGLYAGIPATRKKDL